MPAIQEQALPAPLNNPLCDLRSERLHCLAETRDLSPAWLRWPYRTFSTTSLSSVQSQFFRRWTLDSTLRPHETTPRSWLRQIHSCSVKSLLFLDAFSPVIGNYVWNLQKNRFSSENINQRQITCGLRSWSLVHESRFSLCIGINAGSILCFL